MTNRLFGALYVLSGLWAVLMLFAVGGVETLTTNGAFYVLGLPPLLVVGTVHYVIWGRL